MNPIYLSTFLTVGAAFVASLGIYKWSRQPRERVAQVGAVLLLAGAAWMVGYALELGGTDLQTKLLWAKIEFISIGIVSTSWVLYTLLFAGHEAMLTRGMVIGMSMAPIPFILLVFTNQWHGLIWASSRLRTVGAMMVLDQSMGPGLVVFLAYVYVLMLYGGYNLLSALAASASLYRRQIRVLLFSAGGMMVLSAAGRFGLTPFPYIDHEPLGLFLVGCGVAWSLFRLGLGDIVPIAKQLVVDRMSDAVIVLDAGNRVLELNHAAEELIGSTSEEPIGKTLESLCPTWQDRFGQLDRTEDRSVEIVLEDGERRIFDARVSPLRDPSAGIVARALVLRDITASKSGENALRKANEDLALRNELLAAILNAQTSLQLDLDIDSLMKQVVRAIRDSLGFEIVVLNLLDQATGAVRVAAHAGMAPEAGEAVENTSVSMMWEDYQGLLEERFKVGRVCYFIPQGAIDWHAEYGYAGHDAIGANANPGPSHGSGKWLPEDALIAVIELSKGQTAGMLSVDQPKDGKRPGLETVRALEVFANLAGAAIQNAELYSAAQQELVERRHVEAELSELNIGLETRIAQRTSDLVDANARLQHEIEERKRTENELRRRNRELLSLQSAAAATTSSLDLRFVMETVTWEMASLLSVGICRIYRWDQETDTIEVIAEHGSGASGAHGQAPSPSPLADDPLKLRALRDGRAQQVRLGTPDPRPDLLVNRNGSSAKARLILPLVYQDRIAGLVEVEETAEERTFSDYEISLAQVLANQAATAMENANLYERATYEIDERRRAEMKIKASLAEKEVLLKEIHHRVKNNLQVISSLLFLQSRGVDDEQVQQMFQDSQNRVASMALIHERLYQSRDLARIRFSDYVRSLTSSLVASYGVDIRHVDVVVDAEDVVLTIEEAVPCGLVVNELISNALKHAFPAVEYAALLEGDRTEQPIAGGYSGTSDGRPPMIRVGLHTGDDRETMLRVCDNGVGLPDGFDIHQTHSLGLQLVTTLVKQLRGTLEIRNSEGCEFEIRFRR